MYRLITLFVLLQPTMALAYVGPGPGLSMMGSAITLIVGVLFALFMVVFYPIRLMLKKRKKNKSADKPDQEK